MKKMITLLVIMSAVTGLFLFKTAPVAQATFNANELIDDVVFENAGSMSASQIDTFLNGFPSSCISTNNGFSTPDPQGFSDAQGKFVFGGNVSGGRAIYDVSQQSHINPQVLLATLQKEQSIVTGGRGCHYDRPNPGDPSQVYTCTIGGRSQNCTDACPWSYGGGCMNIAMGYGCPSSCAVADEGFSLQITLGAWILRFGEKRAYGVSTGYPGYINGDEYLSYYGPMVAGTRQRSATSPAVPYDGSYTTLDGTQVTIANGATSTLYNYTPFISGNQSFVNKFETWFGSTRTPIAILQRSDGKLFLNDGGVKHYIPSMDVYNAWNLSLYPMSTPGDAYIDSITQSNDMSRAAKVNGTSDVYFADNGNFYHLSSPAMMAAWQIDPISVVSMSQNAFMGAQPNGELTYSLKKAADSTVYMRDGQNLHAYQALAVWYAWEGEGAGAITVSDSYFNSLTVGSALTSTKASHASNTYLVDGRGHYLLGANKASLYPGAAAAVSDITYNRLSDYGNAGIFVKTSGTSNVYLVDNGATHLVGTAQLLDAWSGGEPLVVGLTPSGMSLFAAGNPITNFLSDASGQLYLIDAGKKLLVPASLDSAYRSFGTPYPASAALMALYPSGSNTTGFIKTDIANNIYLVDGGQKRPIQTFTDYQLLNGSRGEAMTVVTKDAISQLPTGTQINSYVTDGTTNYTFDNGTYYSVSAPVATAWNLTNPTSINAATVSRFTAGGALDDSAKVGSSSYKLINATAYVTSSASLASMWSISSTQLSQTFVGRAGTILPLSHLVRSTNSSDPTVYVFDTNTLYKLPDANMLINFGYVPGSSPFVYMPQTQITSIGASTIAQYIVQNGPNYYVMDGGAKRLIPDAGELSRWQTAGGANVLGVSSNLLAFVPSGTAVSRVIKSTGPNLYAVSSGQRQWISSYQTYQQSYASYPVTTISNQLMAEIPQGPNL